MDPSFHLLPDAPKPVAPYSHAVEAGAFVFVTGQLATDPDDDSLLVPPGIEAQTRKVMDNLSRVLKGCGLAFANRSEEHTSELQSLRHLVCRLLLGKKNIAGTIRGAASAVGIGDQRGTRKRLSLWLSTCLSTRQTSLMTQRGDSSVRATAPADIQAL